MKKPLPELIAFLENYNRWRRGSYLHEQPVPEELGQCLDQAVEMLKKMTWQPMETVPQNRKFFGVWGDNDGCALGYDVFEYIDGAYQSVNDSEWRMPMYSYKMLAWMEIPKYEP